MNLVSQCVVSQWTACVCVILHGSPDMNLCCVTVCCESVNCLCLLHLALVTWLHLCCVTVCWVSELLMFASSCINFHNCTYLLVISCGRAFAYGVMGRWIDPSCWNNWAISCVPASAPQLVLTKPVVCTILSGMVCIKHPLLLIGKSSPWKGGSGFPLSLSKRSLTISNAI